MRKVRVGHGSDIGASVGSDPLLTPREAADELKVSESYLAKARMIRQVLTSSVWREVLAVPARLMSEAGDLSDHAPVRAALRAQVAVGIAILSVAPVRLGNLARIRLEENLIRPAGPSSPYWLVFPGYDVKNGVELQFPLDERLSALIERYVHDYRPALVRGSNEPWLFPGETVDNRGGGHKTPSMFSGQITEQVLKAVGIRITAHQFRHAAAAIILRHDPGNYEFVRRILGHRNVQTTVRFYIGLETTQASERFGKIVRDQLSFGPG